MAMDMESLYEKLRGIITDEATYQATVDAINEEVEREKERRHAKQADGIARALENKVHFGRHSTPKPANYPRILKLYQNHDLNMQQAADVLGVSRSVFYRWVCADREKQD